MPTRVRSAAAGSPVFSATQLHQDDHRDRGQDEQQHFLDMHESILLDSDLGTGCRWPSASRIGGSAHMPNMERPAEFNAALLSFLDQ